MEIVRAGSKSKPVKIIDVDFDTLIDINKDHRFYDQEEKAILHYWSDGKTAHLQKIVNLVIYMIPNYAVLTMRHLKP